MAIGDAYATNAQYKAAKGKTTGDDDSQLDLDLLAVSRGIDRKLGRGATGFNKDAAVVVRRYPPSELFAKTLYVDDIASTAGLIIKVDDNQDGVAEVTLTQTTDFELLPFNAAVGPEPRPYDRLYLPINRVSRISWAVLTEITAIWGWPVAVPQVIVDATIELTAIWRLETPRATTQVSVGFDSMIGTSSRAQGIVDDLMQQYAKKSLVVYA